MATIRQDASNLDGRLDEAVVSYLEALEAGQSPDPQMWLERYPDLTAELKEFFADQEQVNRWTGPLREVTAAVTDIDDPLSTVSDTRATGAPPSSALRDYEILQEIARGGMGIVYKARQVSLNRIVALKMILAGPQISSSDIHRFRLETESAASLDHPNIMPIYEVGEHRGRPYFSMKLIEGGSLAEQLPRYATDQRATARLLAAVARGVHHAHQRGILHRDLKPANILIDAKGQPYVTDFGLARRVEGDSGLTQSGAIVGTPSYMAPEQAAGRKDLSTAADVYSLGAILYTMLTNRPPFRADTPLETVREVLEVEPSRPRLLKRDVDRDLETICLKCLEKQPQRRYGSAEALAEDLERWLAGEPIRARRNSLWERALKSARRHPTRAALLAVSTLALVGLVVGGIVYQGQRAWIAERELSEQRRQNESRQTVQGLLSQADVSLAVGNWQNAKVQSSRALEATGREPALDELKQRAIAQLAVAEQRLAEDQAKRSAQEKCDQFLRHRDDVLFHGTLFTGVDVPRNLAATRQAGAEALNLVGLTIDGEGTLTLDPHFSKDQNRVVTEGCYVLMLLLAEAAAQQDPPDFQQALRLLERAAEFDLTTQTCLLRLARYRERLGDLASAQQARDEAARVEPTGALDHFLLGEDAARHGKQVEAVRHFQNALGADSDHFWARYFLAVVLWPSKPELAQVHLSLCLNQRNDSAWVYFFRGIANRAAEAFPAAESDFAQALTYAAREASRENDLRYAVLVNRGILFHRQSRFAEAIADLRLAIVLKPDWHQAYAHLAITFHEQGDIDAALDHIDRAIDRARAMLAKNTLPPKEMVLLHLSRARFDFERQDWPSVRNDVEHLLAIRPCAEAYSLQGYLFQRVGEYEKAAESYGKALLEPPADSNEYSLAETHRWRAIVLLQLQNYTDARQSLDAYFVAGGKPDAEIYRLRGLIRAETGDYEDALSDYQRALDVTPNDSLTLAARGWVHVIRQSLDLARSDFERAIESDPKNGDAYSGLAYVQVARRDTDQAVANAEEALRLGIQPLTPRLVFNAARVHGLAVTVKEDERRRRGALAVEQQVQYRDRALELLRQGMEMLPESQRRSFWRKTVEPDYARPEGAYWLFRNSPGFRQLAAQYEQSAAAESGR